MSGRPHHGAGCSCRTHLARKWNRSEHWTAAEVDLLERHFGRWTDEAIARRVGRTVVGIRLKAKRLGILKRDAGLTGREVAAIFGIDDGTIGKAWVARGLLKTTRGGYRQGPHQVHIVDGAEVERFIREHPEYIDVVKMPDSPYRDMVARDPWISLVEAHRLTGRCGDAVSALIRSGVVRGRRRGTHWYIPAADVALIRPLRGPDRIEESIFRRESGLQAQRDRRKGISAVRHQVVA